MRLLLLLVFIFSAPLARAEETRRITGLWFGADIPASFEAVTVFPEGPIEDAVTARFASPDGAVTFFIHAPQWGRPTPVIDPQSGTEEVEAERTVADGPEQTTWRTIVNRESGARRSYRIIEDARGPTLSVYGVEYASFDDLARWRDAYLDFLHSIERYAD